MSSKPTNAELTTSLETAELTISEMKAKVAEAEAAMATVTEMEATVAAMETKVRFQIAERGAKRGLSGATYFVAPGRLATSDIVGNVLGRRTQGG